MKASTTKNRKRPDQIANRRPASAERLGAEFGLSMVKDAFGAFQWQFRNRARIPGYDGAPYTRLIETLFRDAATRDLARQLEQVVGEAVAEAEDFGFAAGFECGKAVRS